jgi:cytochrome P450
LGAQAGSDDSERLDEHFAVIDIRNLRRASPAAVRAALAGIEAWMERTDDAEAAREARRACVLHEIVHRTPDALNDPTLVRNLIYMLTTSAGDVAGLVMWVLKLLSDHPAWADRLRREADPALEARSSRSPSLASRIVSETLRLQQSEFVMREIVRPFRHRGFRFPRGWLLRVCVQESHRDPVMFARPEEFDPDRFLGAPPAREQYAPFGLDRHACVGESLARAMAEEFAGALAGSEWNVTSDGPTELSDWRHWAPSARFRVRFAARTNASLPV